MAHKKLDLLDLKKPPTAIFKKLGHLIIKSTPTRSKKLVLIFFLDFVILSLKSRPNLKKP